ncbi:hypothetical protein N7478_008939 [Penicillium angulare]|uniref:uncharacterized protein n=1 Tax=Penicillium angulare TaxID=116970 RepID=UPI00253F8670|nr:uncharacterized protein N7478_008939 [Penicillium angulare]KAJ5273814.1 hypothetical protein N7478_008939 [Penicillium angulare]
MNETAMEAQEESRYADFTTPSYVMPDFLELSPSIEMHQDAQTIPNKSMESSDESNHRSKVTKADLLVTQIKRKAL